LVRAALDGDSGKAKELLSKGADANSIDDDFLTALMLAARGGHTETVSTAGQACESRFRSRSM
jgi:ankyrin repeat protein